MSFVQNFLREFDHEMATTRTLLERVPAEQASWKPHTKSMSLGSLAVHVATLPGFAGMAVTTSERDLNPPGGPAFAMPPFTTTAALLEAFDATVREARSAVAAADESKLEEPWTLKFGGQVIFTQPRALVLRSMAMNHLFHHRGQLTVYLRLLDVPLPSIYGPTADTAA